MDKGWPVSDKPTFAGYLPTKQPIHLFQPKPHDLNAQRRLAICHTFIHQGAILSAMVDKLDCLQYTDPTLACNYSAWLTVLPGETMCGRLRPIHDAILRLEVPCTDKKFVITTIT
jgi:hypothetical protein